MTAGAPHFIPQSVHELLDHAPLSSSMLNVAFRLSVTVSCTPTNRVAVMVTVMAHIATAKRPRWEKRRHTHSLSGSSIDSFQLVNLHFVLRPRGRTPGPQCECINKNKQNKKILQQSAKQTYIQNIIWYEWMVSNFR